MEYAHKEGIRRLDTAHSYQDSEEVIGEFMSESSKDFEIISKMPSLGDRDIISAGKYFLESLRRLQRQKIYGYLIHSFRDVIVQGKLMRALETIKQRGLVQKIGVSIYTPEQLSYLMKKDFPMDIIQIPYNIFDQRFEDYFSDLKKEGIEIHVRSIFLQGLFFLDIDRIKKDFSPANDKVERLKRVSEDSNIPLHALCLCFALLNPFIDMVAVGVDSIEQLKQNINSMRYMEGTEKIYDALKSMKFHNEQIILPYNWQL